MKNKLSPIISPEQLMSLIDSEGVILVDASAGSEARYEKCHLSGAIFADVNTDLAEIGDFAAGGRHPLPTFQSFSNFLTRSGISSDSHVVVYDDKQGSNAAARLWWMLRAVEHEKVQVLDGGFDAAVKTGFPTTSTQEQSTTTTSYLVDRWTLPLSDLDEVENLRKVPDHLVIDVRDASRYAGLTEPIDLVAGHIPGAVNIPFTENLASDGRFLSAETLHEKYKGFLGGIDSNRVIVHCGSGITACHTLLAMDYAGFPIPKLYVGSWSEWSRNNKEMVLASNN